MITKNYNICDFSKKCLFEIHTNIKNTIYNFVDCEDSEKILADLRFEIDCRKIALPTDLYKKIDTFITDELEPIVYDSETVFAEAYSIDTKEDSSKMFACFFTVLFEKEKKWDAFAEKELKPYLI